MRLALTLLIGGAVGFLGGMFGKGGSAVATPLLAAIGVPPIVAVASPLPATIPATVVAYRRFRIAGLDDPGVIRGSIMFGVPATIVGAVLTRWIDGSSLITITEVMVIGLGAKTVLKPDAGDVVRDVGQPRLRLAAVAVTVGLLAGLLANAGGFLLVPLYLAVLKLPIKTALAASLAVATVLAVPGTVVHAALGHIDWSVTAAFGAASIPASSAGARVALRMNPDRLMRVYGSALLAMGAVLVVVG